MSAPREAPAPAEAGDEARPGALEGVTRCGGRAPLGGPALMVHGGAGRHPAGDHDGARAAVRRAADAGWDVLAAGGSAVAAVEAATRVLEDEPRFDAGVGSYLTRDGLVEVDAILCDGRRLDFGAVAAVRGVAHAITLARHVLEDCPHALLAGPGAERFARRLGLTVPAPDLITPEAVARLRRDLARVVDDGPDGPGMAPRLDLGAPAGAGAAAGDRPSRATSDTVGAVAVDARGHVAAATSTGGVSAKWPGRVGDSPIVGAGAWADDLGGAVSSTGPGEAILRVGLAQLVGLALAGGSPPEAAAAAGLRTLGARTGAWAGLIVAAPDGGLAWAQTTREMPWAWRAAEGRDDGL